MYRVTSENPTRHKWVAVAQASSTKLHRMAADFLFTAIGVLSLYMGRDKHSKFLRHLGVLEVALSIEACRAPACRVHPSYRCHGAAWAMRACCQGQQYRAAEMKGL